MEKMMHWIEQYAMPVAAKVSQSRYLNALKDGFAYAIPFLLTGSFVLLLLNLPLTDPSNFLYMEWYTDWVVDARAKYMQPFYVSMGIMTLFISFGIGSSLSASYGLHNITGGFLAMFSFLLVAAPVSEGAMSISYLDAKGIFTAILTAIISVHVLRLCVEKGITIKLPSSVPPAIAKSFELIVPVVFIMVLLHPINLTIDYVTDGAVTLLPELIITVLQPLVVVSDSLPALLLAVFFVQLLWVAGINGGSIVLSVLTPFLFANLQVNQDALQAGEEASRIFVAGFWDYFIFIGGAGCTFSLACVMAFWSKDAHLRTIGRLSIVPGMFNINEPLIFGTPMVMNPILFIPFIFIPMINATIAWFATTSGFVGNVVTLLPWTTPAPLGAFLATNLGTTALLLSITLIITSVLMYLPFVRMYEKTLEAQAA
ncbi:PTS sugar transporter subunit IIC [Photobacterium minamisatsumaniensis]|uniref:PTS sugar transporter subunit IIC n=1 Tax=Photobacterium minamisatsumaniensis TaxID=2910233 RepID=UPI003D0F31CD